MEKLTKQLISQIIKNRKYNYSPEPLESFLRAHPAVRCNNFTVKNKHNETLSGMLLKQTYTDTCVLYAHGLGSNKLQALPAAEEILSWGMNVCAFDFAGSGRSEGDHTTYGVREQDDINAVLAWLDATRQFSKYVLWGRSMGGTSILMSQTRITNEKVQCIVLDSPFSSFERVATEIASKSSIVPSVLISLMMDPLRKEFERHYPHLNPFNLDILSTVEKIDTKMIIMYSRNDRIVSYQHSKQISKRSRRNPIQIQIQEDHNKLRTKATYKQVRKYIDDCINQHNRRAKRSRSKGRGISVTSKDNQKVSKCRTSICSSAITEKSSNTELLSYPICSTEIEGTPGSLKKPAIIKSLLMKNSHKTTKLFSFELTTNKQNSRGRINFPSEKRKQRPSILGCFQ